MYDLNSIRLDYQSVRDDGFDDLWKIINIL